MRIVTEQRGARPVFRLTGVIVLSAWLAAGCGNPDSIDFPNRLIGADGQDIVLDEILAITGDADLSDDQMREQLRALGIEDEELIDALVAR